MILLSGGKSTWTQGADSLLQLIGDTLTHLCPWQGIQRERTRKNKHWRYWSIRPSWCWWNIYHQVAKYTFIFICVIFTKQDHVWASNISPQIQETKTCSKDYNSQTLAEWNQRWPIGRGRGRIIAAVRDTLTSVI